MNVSRLIKEDEMKIKILGGKDLQTYKNTFLHFGGVAIPGGFEMDKDIWDKQLKGGVIRCAHRTEIAGVCNEGGEGYGS